MGAGSVPALRPGIPVLATIAVAGGAITLIGSALPWATIFRGTQTLTGWNGTPRYLAGLALASAALTALFVWAGRPASLRNLAALTGLAAVAGVGFEVWQTMSLASSRSMAAAFLEPSVGPGPFVMLIGALLLITVAAIPVSGTRLMAGSWTRIIMAGALFASGWIHLALTPEHLGEATILGIGFLVAGLAQLFLAGLILVRPSDLAYYAVVGLSVSLVVLYAIAVVHGLPFGGGHDHLSGIIIGSGEPVDLEGAVSKVCELLSVAIALVLVGRAGTTRFPVRA